MNFLTIRKLRKVSKTSNWFLKSSRYFRSQIGIKNSDIGCRFIGQWNTILSEMHFKFAILRTKIILSPRFCITLFNRKIVIFYCLFRGYQHPKSDNVEQTAARLFWNLAIGSSRLVVPSIILGFLHLMDFIADFHYVLRNIMENMLVFMTLTKFGVRRIKCQPLSKFLTEAEDDYIIDNYKTKEVRLIFMKYNNIASKFIILYFSSHFRFSFEAILVKILEKKENSKLSCIQETVITTSHIRKMSLQKVTYLPRICFRLADILEDSFNIVICLHMVDSTILLCTSRYQMLFSLARLERVYIFTFLIYFCLPLCTLYSYCHIGQCLIEECDAIYHCDWYELSTINLKSLRICMVRARKPLQLTGAKFGVVSSCTFTDVNHSEDIDGVLISSTNIYANKRVKRLVLNIYYTGILLLACR
ncbi:odorant receptor 13a-like [Vespula squamosa]|uniref:Odorant receptor n=1 Tax=Vespula squamosa TaxID=30214 RepID=A0ABD2BW19_VESSQ